MRIHLLGCPFTITHPEYRACAFTQLIIKLARMLQLEGHHVIHYGNYLSQAPCDEHVTVTTIADLDKSYPGRNHMLAGQPPFDVALPVYREFLSNSIEAIRLRMQPGDFLMATIGVWHEPIADALPELLCVEPNISYPNGAFAQFRVYNSYAMMNAYQGTEFATNPSNNHWYDAMIPIAFDPQEFPLRTDKEDYLLFVGRLIKGKGVHLARTLAENTGMKLIIAGDGPEVQPDTKFVKHIGVIGADERNKLMAGAKALLYPSHYMEPFGAAQIEAMLCGTPVVSSDFGAFSEYNIHGLTGYRCRTYEQFEFAVRKLDRLHLDPFSIRRHAERFSFRNVAPMYTDYLKSVAVLDKPGGMGWYEPRPDRTSLDSTIFSVC